MGRRKMPEGTKKVITALSMAPESKEMLFCLADAKGMTASAMVEEYVKKEYGKMRKAGKCRDVGVPGQMQLPVQEQQEQEKEVKKRTRRKE